LFATNTWDGGDELFEELNVELTLRINASTGAMFIKNTGVDPTENTQFDIDGYVIESPAGALNAGGFTGLSGAGQADWQIVAPSAEALSELNLYSSTVFDEGDSLSLGAGFTPGPEDPELTFQYSVTGQGPAVGAVEFFTGIPGDFNDDGNVNAADYTTWRDNLGAPAGTLPNDTDGGVIGGAQYTTWKANFGMSLLSSASFEGAAVPEPATCLTLMLGTSVGLFGVSLRRHRRGEAR
jgi:hypothetical protein